MSAVGPASRFSLTRRALLIGLRLVFSVMQESLRPALQSRTFGRIPYRARPLIAHCRRTSVRGRGGADRGRTAWFHDIGSLQECRSRRGAQATGGRQRHDTDERFPGQGVCWHADWVGEFGKVRSMGMRCVAFVVASRSMTSGSGSWLCSASGSDEWLGSAGARGGGARAGSLGIEATKGCAGAGVVTASGTARCGTV